MAMNWRQKAVLAAGVLVALAVVWWPTWMVPVVSATGRPLWMKTTARLHPRPHGNDPTRKAALRVNDLAIRLVVLAGGTTLAIVFLRDRPGPGLCPKCRYRLPGNVSGVCPECGQPTPR